MMKDNMDVDDNTGAETISRSFRRKSNRQESFRRTHFVVMFRDEMIIYIVS